MSMFGDYKIYKKYEPVYDVWKYQRDYDEAKRQKYLELHPESINSIDIQKGKTLIRAIDVMDEYSQKKAENMEVATESIVSNVLSLAVTAGGILGGLIGSTSPVRKFLGRFGKNSKHAKYIPQIITASFGVLVALISAFPLYAWAAKVEVGASRKGRFEAMRKELANPKGFAILTEEQQKEAAQKAQHINLKDDNTKLNTNILNGLHSLKDMAIDSKEYKQQRRMFELQQQEELNHIDDYMTPEEELKAKQDQQLLTKLVEKIDIASQDYAENAELATSTAVTIVTALGALYNVGLQKILNFFKIRSTNKLAAASQGIALAAPIILSIFAAQIQKQASRVGRFKVKQELMNNPSQLVYVSDSQTGDIKDVQIEPYKKQGIFSFLTHAWKNNQEYNNYKKTQALEEKKFYQAVETLDMSPEQIKDAKRLQKNTFKTFNKVDENSQKYSENIEALGQAIGTPILTLFSMAGIAWGLRYLNKSITAKTAAEKLSGFSKYLSAVILSSLPGILINAYITKEQKKASRIANMMAINEMSDYRQFK